MDNRSRTTELQIKDLSDTDFQITMVNMLKRITDELGDFSRELKAIKNQMEVLELKKIQYLKLRNQWLGLTADRTQLKRELIEIGLCNRINGIWKEWDL